MLGYIDPGSGGLLLQLLAAGVIGTALFFRRALGRLLGFLKRNPPSPPQDPPA
jgi:hypothetical protein